MWTKLIAAGCLLIGGWLMLPVEKEIYAQREHVDFGRLELTLDVRERLPQELALGVLAGFRGIAADFLWIQNEAFWEDLWEPRTDKGLLFVRMYRNMKSVVVLQPHSTLFWEESAWHMGWNIAYAAQIDPANRTKAEGLKREMEWRERARAFLAEGIKNNPDTYRLYFYMGILYLQKLASPAKPELYCTAADYFRRAAAFPDAPSYTARECAHALELCGKPEAAYEYWKTIWNGGHVRHFHDQIDIYDDAIREMRRLENELKIPVGQRIFPTVVRATRS